MANKDTAYVNASRTERTSIRWLMVFYDTLVFVFLWSIFFVLIPSLGNENMFNWNTALACLAVGYVLFFGFRLLRNSYKQILRYGAVQAFSREMQATVLASLVLLVLRFFVGSYVGMEKIPIPSLVSFSALYVIVSVGARFAYYHFYCVATGDSAFGRIVRSLISLFFRVDFDSQIPGAVLPMGRHAIRLAGPINELQRIIDQFAIQGSVTHIEQINKGYINQTYYVETLSARGHVHKYTLQRINTNVFPDVDALMDNFKLTTEHLYGRLSLPGRHIRGSVHSLRQTKDGHLYLRDASGCWRMVTYFDDVYSVDIPENPEVFHNAGIAFGNFIKEMADVNIEDVKIVIPNFHNTLSRYQDLEKSIADDPKGRVESVENEIAFVRARADRYDMISQALEAGEIPTRICHNDCNLNNILFDRETNLPVAIIDLDTVMPSSALYDFGDSIRIGANTAKDDEKDLTKVSCDLELFEAYAWGYLESCGKMLTPKELELLPYAALIITAEDGIRFLMDYINGDTYYHIYYPEQNLDRARTQLKMVDDMEQKLPEIKKILQKIYQSLNLEA